MNKNIKTEHRVVALLCESEERVRDYCEELYYKNIELSELDDEIEQVIYENRLLTNIVNRISNRIEIVRSGYSNPEIALDEISSIVDEVDQ